MIKLRNFFKSFGPKNVLRSLDLDIDSGEIVVIKKNTIESVRPFKKTKLRPCLFEYIYFSRPDSILQGRNVYDVRK